MTNVLPEVGSVLTMMPAASGTVVRIQMFDHPMTPTMREYSVIAFAVVVDWSAVEDGVARYSTRIDPVIIVEGVSSYPTTLGAHLDGKRALVDEICVKQPWSALQPVQGPVPAHPGHGGRGALLCG